MAANRCGNPRNRRDLLSPRQEQILACYSAGMSQREIAKKMRINICALEHTENLISDHFKEYEMTDCASKWLLERSNAK